MKAKNQRLKPRKTIILTKQFKKAWNFAANRLFGYENGELVGRRVRGVLPDENQNGNPFGALKKICDSNDNSNTSETIGLRKDDTEFPVEAVVTPVDGGFVCQLRDISRSRLSTAMDAVLHATLRRVMRGQTYEQFCPYICEKIVDLLGCPLAWIGKKEKDGSVAVCAAAGTLAAGFPGQQIRWDDLSEKFGPTGQAIRTKRTKII